MLSSVEKYQSDRWCNIIKFSYHVSVSERRFYFSIVQHNTNFSIFLQHIIFMCWDIPMESTDSWDGTVEQQQSTEHVWCLCDPPFGWIDLYWRTVSFVLYCNELSELKKCNIAQSLILRSYDTKYSVRTQVFEYTSRINITTYLLLHIENFLCTKEIGHLWEISVNS